MLHARQSVIVSCTFYSIANNESRLQLIWTLDNYYAGDVFMYLSQPKRWPLPSTPSGWRVFKKSLNLFQSSGFFHVSVRDPSWSPSAPLTGLAAMSTENLASASLTNPEDATVLETTSACKQCFILKINVSVTLQFFLTFVRKTFLMVLFLLPS